MANAAVLEELNKIFCEVFDDDQIRIFREMTAKDIAGWDSLNHINLIVAVEKRFDIKFTTREIMTYENVGQFADAVEEKLLKSGRTPDLIRR
ncbi:MAG: hypothetical protein A3D87_03565 [Omnitrophica WOR_2 bacterium RIFCSPHIGHO2_02_FULL_50_17]|nr:MAG: hypothetical protein A3D87_03565 [Omnitrophica WOR_2 bacterium RIFCSPHIGHO2_02_FULL_50_17]